jgi:hypothetical protein
MAAWFYPPSGQAARSISMTPFNGGIAVADWTTPQFFPFVNGVLGNPIVLGSGTPGLSAVANDGDNGLWAVTYGGTIWHMPPTGMFSLKATLAPNNVYVGVTGSGYALSSNGTVWGSTSGTVTGAISPWSLSFSNDFGGGMTVPPISGAVGSWPTPAISMVTSGTTLMAILPASGIGTMSYTGTTGLISLPGTMPVASCLAAAAGSSLAVGGWNTAPPLSGAAAGGLDPQNNEDMLTVGSGFARIWSTTAPFTEKWAQTNSLSGLANLNSMYWVPNGIQVLATSLVSGTLQVIGFSANVLSLSQTLPISGACSVGVSPSSTNALVVQSGQSQLATLTAAGGTWSSGTPITGLVGITAVTMFGTSGAAVGFVSGIAFLGLNDNTWSVQQTAFLPFIPTVITSDSYNQIYAAGSGHIVVASGTAITGSGTFTGIPTSIAVQQGRVIIAVPGNGLLTFGNVASGIWTQQSSGTLSLGASVSLALSETVLFVMGSGATNTYGFSGAQYNLTPVTSGACALWNGSSWSVTPLGIGTNPSAIAFDASGQVQLTTIQNGWWTLSSTGSVLSSGIVPQISSQLQTVPIGSSSVLAFSGGLYTATSLSGTLIELV